MATPKPVFPEPSVAQVKARLKPSPDSPERLALKRAAAKKKAAASDKVNLKKMGK